ncbi:MAG TPA: SDR family NAD(P)-dependent oxidoreductase [Methylomirabilota bacterium]|jgi:NAD(P)-dependent dehydrogenase (short-subunit alcohol dehydrogenase family)|nr:SDR family NAD(P)-dependent oxidoreductase [Methylomirabilota bacterium]
MDLGLQGKVAIITGGSDGLGLAAAQRLAAEGTAVAICGRDATRLKAATETLRARGAAVLDVPADVTRSGDLEGLVSSTLERFGRVDILVNNAGTSAARGFETVDDAAWQHDLELKLFAAIRCVRLCVPLMRKAGGGRIVNILNTGAKAPAARSLPTSVSRAAGLALTKALSKELAPDGILVNAICLGLVKSGQWERRWAHEGRPGTLDAFYERMARERGVPVGRIGEADELGALVAFLVSAPAAFITGVAVNFDGGQAAVV